MSSGSRRELLRTGLLLPAAATAACRSTESAGSAAPPAASSVRDVRDVRGLAMVMDAAPTMEGAGVHLRRSIGSRALSLLDPFLLLDGLAHKS
jgi:hypothetical protein